MTPIHISLAELESAAAIVGAQIPPTLQRRWPRLDERAGCEVWVKHENLAPTGAFKIRGGVLYMDSLRHSSHPLRGVVAATRGNHGQSVALAAASLGIRVVLVVPIDNEPAKNKAMRALGAELVEEGADFQESMEIADRIAAKQGLHRVPSFDKLLVTGVATWALELFRAAPPLDTLYVPIGLGSGICGAIAARDALGLTTKITGVVSSNAPAYALSIAAGRLVSHPATTKIADGIACRTPDPVALEIIRSGAERIIDVSDDEIVASIQAIFTDTQNVAEGAGAAALAALLKEKDRPAGSSVGIVISGANIDPKRFAGIVSRDRPDGYSRVVHPVGTIR